MNLKRRTFRSAFISSLLAFGAAPAPAADYIVTPLQDVPSGYEDIYVSGIGSTGTISGYAFRLDSYTAVIWDGAGVATSLFPGDSGESTAYDVNASGQVLVNYYGPYIWQDGVATPISVNVSAQPLYGPDAMNDAGDVTGTGYFLVDSSYQRHAFVVRDGVTVDLGVLPGATASWSTGINNAGDVVGYSYTPDNLSRAVLWRDGAIVNLGTLSGQTSSTATAVNDNGRVVGSSGTRMFTWENGVMTDLGGFGAGAVMNPRAINNHGDIVGQVSYPASNTSKAFLWSNGVFTDLDAVLGYSGGCDAVDINDAGQIAIGCGYGRGVFRLTPSTPTTDLTLTMTHTTGSIVIGTPFTYTLNIGNAGSLVASNVIVSDALPAGLTLVSATTTQGNCSGSAVVTCSLNAIAGGATAAVQITVVANVTGSVTNSANVSGSEVETNTFNNAASNSVYIVAANADMGVTLSASASSVKRLSNFTYTISVRNNGPANATGVKVTDSLPSGMSFVSASTTQGSCSGTTTVTCDLGAMANASNATVKITVQARTRGTFTNTAKVSADQPDSVLGSNSSSVTVSVR